MDCSPPDAFVHGIILARILEWVAISFSRRSSRPRIEPASPVFPALVGRFLTMSHLGIPKFSLCLLPNSDQSTSSSQDIVRTGERTWDKVPRVLWSHKELCKQSIHTLVQEAMYGPRKQWRIKGLFKEANDDFPKLCAMGSEKRESVIGEVMEGFLGRTGGRERKQKWIKDEQHVGRPWSHGN